MQTNPISTEMSARVHFDDLAREVERERAAQTIQKLAAKRAPWGRAWLATWLRHLSSRQTHAIDLETKI